MQREEKERTETEEKDMFLLLRRSRERESSLPLWVIDCASEQGKEAAMNSPLPAAQ